MVQVALTAAGPQSIALRPQWRELSYAPEETKLDDSAEGALRQLLQLLATAPIDQQCPLSSTDCEVKTGDQHLAEEQRIEVTRLAARFTEALTEQLDAAPRDVLMTTYDELIDAVPVRDGGSSDEVIRGDAESSLVDGKHPCLLLLRCSKMTSRSQIP